MRTELYGFSDASLLCYAACIFLRFIKRDGDVKVSFVTAKSRLTPIKKDKNCNIPRLELMGNLFFSKLVINFVNSVSEEINIDEITC